MPYHRCIQCGGRGRGNILGLRRTLSSPPWSFCASGSFTPAPFLGAVVWAVPSSAGGASWLSSHHVVVGLVCLRQPYNALERRRVTNYGNSTKTKSKKALHGSATESPNSNLKEFCDQILILRHYPNLEEICDQILISKMFCDQIIIL